MILDRYILRLWLVPFAGGLGIFTSLLMLLQTLKLMKLITDTGAIWGLLGKLVLFGLPYSTLITVPTAFFLSMQSVISSLQQSSEMDAMRSAGLSYLRVFRVMIAVAILLYIGLTFMSMYWIPKGQLAFNTLIREVYNLKGPPSFTPGYFSSDMDHFTFYVNGVDDNGLYHGLIVEDKTSGPSTYYLSETAKLTIEMGAIHLHMHNGSRLQGEGENQRVLTFKDYEAILPLDRMGGAGTLRSKDYVTLMTPSELWRQVQHHPSPQASAEWAWRLVLPITPIVLCMFALPLSLSPKRSGRAGSFLLGITLLVVLYNMLLVFHQQTGMGTLPSWSLWAGQGAFLIGGIETWRRAEKGTLPNWLAQSGELFYFAHQRITYWMGHRAGRSAKS
ncbi:MAG TPA: LptF/LptG family permease [Mariprofundaceae bacterium]|nr:LptF/LptG family permease [Mariprofundaceae bacterium]